MVNSINANIAAFFAQANINVASQNANSNIARLSSGNRIVQSSDDAAGLAIGTSLATQVIALKTAQSNVSQGISLLQVADGAAAQITSILQRQKALASASASDSATNLTRGQSDLEFQALTQEIDRIATNTNFNGLALIDGSLSGANPLQIAQPAANDDVAVIGGFSNAGNTVSVGISNTAPTFKALGTFADTTFIGDLSKGKFKVDFDGFKGFAISFSINGSTYSTTIVDTSATATTFVLSNGDATTGTGKITFTLTNTGGTGLVGDGYAQSTGGATSLETDLTKAFSGATAYGVHKVSKVLATSGATKIAGSAIESTTTDGTLLANFDGSDVTLSSALFNGLYNPTISGFTANGFGTGTIFSVLVNGQTYSTEKSTNGTTVVGLTAANSAAGIMKFYLGGDITSNEKLTLDFSTTTPITASASIATQASTNQFLAALNSLFGSVSGGLSFQVGSATTDTVGVSIANLKSTNLFNSVLQGVDTKVKAVAASTAIDSALNAVTSARAGLGALESRFNFASLNLQSSIQNQTAAASGFLDADIPSESTAFATNQVKLQAGISVLAQANQQAQAFLKLIGG